MIISKDELAISKRKKGDLYVLIKDHRCVSTLRTGASDVELMHFNSGSIFVFFHFKDAISTYFCKGKFIQFHVQNEKGNIVSIEDFMKMSK